jgi:Novel STAND NTPase 1
MDDRFVPYKGLIPYAEEDADFFFGRDRDRDLITANLMAARLTILYGESGVGKTSVLRAGVAHGLERLAVRTRMERATPEFVVVVFNDWRDDPMGRLIHQIQDAAERAIGHGVGGVAQPDALCPTLERCSQAIQGDFLVVLDQFEEYFLYHDGVRDHPFVREFARAVTLPQLRTNFLVSIREDSVAKLDRFKGQIPLPLENSLRIDHLDQAAARRAIEGPIEQYNRVFADEQPVHVEPALVDAVLEQVQTGRVSLDAPAEPDRRAAPDRPATATRIETPYLQLVMERIWTEEMRTGSRNLTAATLERLGGAQRIVRTHLDQAMSVLPSPQLEVASKLFRYMVTPSGTKIAYSVSDLADLAEVPTDETQAVIDRLTEGDLRILRTVTPPPPEKEPIRHEIFHDVLALAVLDWRRRYLEARAEAKARRRRRLAAATLAVLASILTVVLVVVLTPTPERVQPRAALSLQITDADFGPLRIGLESRPITIATVQNNGRAPLEIRNVDMSGDTSEFTLSEGGCSSGETIASDRSCEVIVVFKPLDIGGRSATVVISHNGPSSPTTVPVTGRGIDPGIDVSTNVVQLPDDVALGRSSRTSITVISTGRTPLSIIGAEVSGPDAGDFVVDASSCIEAPVGSDESCSIDVVFEPSAVGSRSATLVIRNNAGGPSEVELRGTGVQGVRISAFPASIEFGNPEETQTVVVVSEGETPVTVFDVFPGGASPDSFRIDGTACIGALLQQGETCSITVTFAQFSEGSYFADLVISHSGPEGQIVVALAGTVPPQVE